MPRIRLVFTANPLSRPSPRPAVPGLRRDVRLPGGHDTPDCPTSRGEASRARALGDRNKERKVRHEVCCFVRLWGLNSRLWTAEAVLEARAETDCPDAVEATRARLKASEKPVVATNRPDGLPTQSPAVEAVDEVDCPDPVETSDCRDGGGGLSSIAASRLTCAGMSLYCATPTNSYRLT
jgi:hypothetical protein